MPSPLRCGHGVCRKLVWESYIMQRPCLWPLPRRLSLLIEAVSFSLLNFRRRSWSLLQCETFATSAECFHTWDFLLSQLRRTCVGTMVASDVWTLVRHRSTLGFWSILPTHDLTCLRYARSWSPQLRGTFPAAVCHLCYDFDRLCYVGSLDPPLLGTFVASVGHLCYAKLGCWICRFCYGIFVTLIASTRRPLSLQWVTSTTSDRGRLRYGTVVASVVEY